MPRTVRACPRCGSRNIQIEDYDREYVYVYCEDCDETIEVPNREGKGERRNSDDDDEDDRIAR